jgi:hypothetical protein
VVISSISPPFGRLFQARGQITYVLLTRAPLYSGSCPPFLARLACVRHAASVRSEPGSNSPVKAGVTSRRFRLLDRYVSNVPSIRSARLALLELSAISLPARRRGIERISLLPSFQRPEPRDLGEKGLHMGALLGCQGEEAPRACSSSVPTRPTALGTASTMVGPGAVEGFMRGPPDRRTPVSAGRRPPGGAPRDESGNPLPPPVRRP